MNRFTAGLALVLYAAHPADGEARPEGKRTAQDNALLAPLERDAGFQEIQCFSRPQEHDEKFLAAAEASNRATRAVYDAMQSRQGVVKVKKTCPTVEGRPVTNYLIVDRGTMTWIQDSTGDPSGGGATAYEVSAVDLGYFEDGQLGLEWHSMLTPQKERPLVLRYMFIRDSGPSFAEF